MLGKQVGACRSQGWWAADWNVCCRRDCRGWSEKSRGLLEEHSNKHHHQEECLKERKRTKSPAVCHPLACRCVGSVSVYRWESKKDRVLKCFLRSHRSQTGRVGKDQVSLSVHPRCTARGWLCPPHTTERKCWSPNLQSLSWCLILMYDLCGGDQVQTQSLRGTLIQCDRCLYVKGKLAHRGRRAQRECSVERYRENITWRQRRRRESPALSWGASGTTLKPEEAREGLSWRLWGGGGSAHTLPSTLRLHFCKTVNFCCSKPLCGALLQPL